MDIETSISEMVLRELCDVPEWMKSAACNGTPLDPFSGADADQFVKLCRSCPVIEPCRQQYTTFHDEKREVTRGVFHGVQYDQEG